MASREQSNFDSFKLILADNLAKEEKKLESLLNVKDLIGDKQLTIYIGKRQNFLSFCQNCHNNIQNILSYQGNEKLIDAYQKDYYLTIDALKKEALKLMAKNQKMWFEKLFTNNFDLLKSLLRSMLISESRSELATNERVIQEIELLRFKEGYK